MTTQDDKNLDTSTVSQDILSGEALFSGPIEDASESEMAAQRIDVERVNTLKHAISRGEYDIDAAKLEAVVDEMLGDPETSIGYIQA